MIKTKNETKKKPKQRECALISNREETKNVSKEECVGAFWATHVSDFLPLVFSPFWGENFLVGLGRKHLNPTIFFFHSFSQPNTY